MTDEVALEHAVDERASDWDELATRTAALPFVRPGWIRSWWEAFGHGDLAVLVARRDGRVTGVLPIQRVGGRVRLPANMESGAFELVAEDDRARGALVVGLYRLPSWSTELQFLDVNGGDLPVARREADAARRRRTERFVERSPYVPVVGGFDVFLENRSAKLVADVRRRRRRLAEEAGSVELVVSDGSEQLHAFREAGYALEASGWKGEERTSIGARPAARRFYDAMTEWAAEEGILRLAFLRAGGRDVAFQLGIESDNVYYFCKGGYDVEYHRFAPGKLLVHDMLERAFELRLRSFEFLGDAEAWKLDWTDAVRERRALETFDRSIRGSAAWAAERYGRPVAKRARLKTALLAARRGLARVRR